MAGSGTFSAARAVSAAPVAGLPGNPRIILAGMEHSIKNGDINRQSAMHRPCQAAGHARANSGRPARVQPRELPGLADSDASASAVSRLLAPDDFSRLLTTAAARTRLARSRPSLARCITAIQDKYMCSQIPARRPLVRQPPSLRSRYAASVKEHLRPTASGTSLTSPEESMIQYRTAGGS